MPLDCHLFANLQEGASKNVALTFHIKEGNKDDQDPDPNSDIKYSFAMPKKVFDALQGTPKSGCPSKKHIKEDIFCVYKETLQCIVNAEGIYIEDSSKKIVQNGIRGEAEAHNRREALAVDPIALEGFNRILVKMEKGEGVSFVHDLTAVPSSTVLI
jgi:hypothetical protein